MRDRSHLRLVETAPPLAIVRRAEITPGTVFWFWGRALKVVRSHGSDAAAPVVLEELMDGPGYLAGQFCLWSADLVTRAMTGRPAAASDR